MSAPRSAFEVRRDANAHSRMLGFRQQQVDQYLTMKPTATLGDLKRDLDFYDKAGALRALRGLMRRRSINNNPSS